jgi:hypothetical protein
MKESCDFQPQHARFIISCDQKRLIIKNPIEKSINFSTTNCKSETKKKKNCEFGKGREKKKRVLLGRRRHCRPRTLIQFSLAVVYVANSNLRRDLPFELFASGENFENKKRKRETRPRRFRMLPGLSSCSHVRIYCWEWGISIIISYL